MRALLALIALVAAAGLNAQSAVDSSGVRDGFYGSAGIGYGAARPGADLGDSVHWENEGGASYYAALGLTVVPHLRIGAEFNYFQSENAFPAYFGSGVLATSMFFSVAVAYYPSLATNFWVKGNIGYANLIGARSGLHATEGGLAGGLGLGYDWMIGHSQFAVIPFINYFVQFSPGTFGGVLEGTGDTGKTSLFQAGVGIGYRH